MKDRKNINYYVETIIEKYNGIIQPLILAIAVGISCWLDIKKTQAETPNDVAYLFEIIITLMIALIIEIILLQIKDSMTQRKLNNMGEVIRKSAKYEEDIWKVETDLRPFFNNTRKELFISGIIVDKLLRTYNHEIRELLNRGVTVKILLESFDEVEEATKFLYGQDYGAEKVDFMRSKLRNTFLSLEPFTAYMSDEMQDTTKGKLIIGMSCAPFVNPAIVAYDYTPGRDFEARKTELSTAPEMSVRFYMQGVDGNSSKLKAHPTLLINSNIMPKQYDDFVEVINNTWNFSKRITTTVEFNNIKNTTENN